MKGKVFFTGDIQTYRNTHGHRDSMTDSAQWADSVKSRESKQKLYEPAPVPVILKQNKTNPKKAYDKKNMKINYLKSAKSYKTTFKNIMEKNKLRETMKELLII